MKISYNWLKHYIKTDLSATQIAELLTDGGLEVETIETYESIKGGLNGLVVGEVVTCDKHPDADRLKVTTVNIGAVNPLHIVCGAPNVAAGQKVIVALVGAKLYPTEGEPFEIKKSKIRGVVSEGMICAEDEIGLGKSHDGIMVLPNDIKVGLPAAHYFNVSNDFIFEIGLTPNRTDAMSHMGVARDLAALIKQRLNINPELVFPQIDEIKSSVPCPIKVEVESADFCPRYSGVYLKNIKVQESPTWLKTALESIGLRSINNVVDVTNYVMHECGQPLHAFDADKIKGGTIKVACATEGAKFKTLDGVERNLKATHLMINNAEEPMCIAGVFGGLESGVTDTTVNVFLESAYFNSASVRKTARELQLKTDSSFRFERGTDPNMVLWALQRAANLLAQIAGATVEGGIVDVYPFKINPKELTVSVDRICKYIGKTIPTQTIESILESLEIKTEKINEDELKLWIPPFKADVSNEADIVEEVLRIYGFNNIETPTKINASVNYTPKPQPDAIQNRISDLLSAQGFNEMMALSLTKDQLNQTTQTLLPDSVVELLNPVSNEVNMLRQHLLTGALQAVAYNLNRKQKNLKFYEFGKVYFKTADGYNEEKHLSLTVTGFNFEPNWQKQALLTDFFVLKENVVRIFSSLGVEEVDLVLNELEKPFAQYAFSITIKNRVVGYLCRVKDSILKKMDIDQEVYYANILFDELMHLAKKSKIVFKEIPKFPEVKRDLALLVDKSVTYEQLRMAAWQADKKLIKQISLFDIYEGDKLPADKKSYALSFTLQDTEGTLNDKTIEKTMERVLKSLQEKTGAGLR